ncbi:MAG: dihydroorotase, partial [Nitrosomonadales bacterium]|nr:dihydroorotase [Nitrosomonadales bacterium]
AGALDKLEAFASFNGPAFYDLPRNTGTVTLQRQTWTLPAELPLGDATIVPLNGGESIAWKLL